MQKTHLLYITMLTAMLWSPATGFATSFSSRITQEKLQTLTPEQVQLYIQRFPQPEQVQMVFMETRTLPPLTRPLLSQGKMLLLRDQGIIWQREEPFMLTTVITQSNVTQWIGDRREEQTQDKPIYLTSLARSLTDIFSGRYDKVLRDFTVKGTLSETEWMIALEPRMAMMRPYINGIVIAGGRYPRQVDIYEGEGKHTRITLSQHTTHIDPTLRHAFTR